MEVYIILLALAGFVALDTTGGPQLLISEPLVSCTLAGYILGSVETGIMIGMLFQLLWFGYLPLGAVRMPDSNMSAFISTVSLITAGKIFTMDAIEQMAAIIPALLFGLGAGIAGSKLQTAVRRLNGAASDRLLDKLEEGESFSIEYRHLHGMLRSFSRGILMACILIPLCTVLCGSITILPDKLIAGLASMKPLIWGTACASAVIVSIMKGNTLHLISGAAGGVLWLTIL